jgi:hypothetical protein
MFLGLGQHQVGRDLGLVVVNPLDKKSLLAHART